MTTANPIFQSVLHAMSTLHTEPKSPALRPGLNRDGDEYLRVCEDHNWHIRFTFDVESPAREFNELRSRVVITGAYLVSARGAEIELPPPMFPARDLDAIETEIDEALTERAREVAGDEGARGDYEYERRRDEQMERGR